MIWEIKKILKTKGMIAVCLILVAVVCLYAYYLSKDKYADNGMDRDIKQLNRQYSDSDELFEALSAEYEYAEQQVATGGSEEAYRRMNRLMPLYNLAKYICVDFEKSREKTVRAAVYDSLDVNGKEINDRKILGRSKMIQKYYGTAYKLEFADAGDSEFYMYFHMNVLDVVLLPIIIFIAVTAFTIDRNSNAEKLLAGCSRSRRADALDRFSAAVIIGMAICAATVIYEIIAARFVYHVKDFSLLMQQFEEYSMCPFSISIGQFFVLDFLCRVVAVIFIVAVTDLVCSFIRNGYVAMFISLVISMAPFLFYRNCVIKSVTSGNVVTGSVEYKFFQLIRTVGPYGLLDIKRYMINLDMIYAGRWILRVHVALLSSLFLSAMFLVIAVRRNSRARK